MTTKTDIDLLRCPFCGGQAEMDTRQGYLALGTGRLGNRIAAYCRSCNADMGVCVEDVPDIEPEQVADMWNRRAAVEADRQGRMPSEPLIVFGEGPWIYKPTGQQFSGADLDGAAFTEYGALLARYSSGQPKPSNSTELKQPAASAEPAVWVAADTLYSAHPTCISSLAYMSQIDHDRGREYVPLAIINHHAAPVAQGPVAWPKNAEEVREFIGTNFISRKSGDVASDDDEYFLTAHDLLSAFDWWSDIAPVDARAAKDRT